MSKGGDKLSINEEMIKIFELHPNYDKCSDSSDKEKEYLNYILEHKENVVKAFETSLTNENYKNNYDELYLRVISHDYSKLDDEEFEAYRNYFYPNEDEVKNEEDFNKAWEHHYKNNSHHPEYYGKNKMPEIDILEMIIDWEAMAIKFGGSAKEFYESKKKQELIDNEFNIDFEYLESNFFM